MPTQAHDDGSSPVATPEQDGHGHPSAAIGATTPIVPRGQRRVEAEQPGDPGEPGRRPTTAASPVQVTWSQRTATTTQSTRNASDWVQPTTATAGRRRENSPAKKSEVPQHALDASASRESMRAALPAPRHDAHGVASL